MSKVIILLTTPAAPDHNSTRVYSEGEEYEVGSNLMPQWLSDNFVFHGIARRVGKVEQVEDAIDHAVHKVVDTSKDKPVSHEPGPSEIKKTPPSTTHAAPSHTTPSHPSTHSASHSADKPKSKE